jgi:hypothetical protein
MSDDEGLAESSPRWWEFEQFVRQILAHTAGVSVPDLTEALIPVRRRQDLGFDIEARRNGRPLLVEIKSQTPQTAARLREMAEQLRVAANRYVRAAEKYGMIEPPALLAVFPGVVSRAKLEFARLADVEIWDGQYLREHADQSGIPVPSFVAFQESEARYDSLEPTEDLLFRLDHIAPGRNDAVGYEKWCENSLSLLFCPPLNPPIVQSRNDSRSNRRDLIMPNYATRGFWHFMRNHYDAAYVVAEAKNASSPIGKDEVLQLGNYLSRHGTGLFGMLLTRKGMNASAGWTRREHWVLHDKMMICLDDEDMRQMLDTKRAGNDPSELVQQKIEDFRLRI